MKLLPYNSENGFTLVEVLVALFIIALVILGGGMFFFYGRVTIVREAHRRAAVLVASQRLEELKGADYSEISGLEDEYYIRWGDDGNWVLESSLYEEPVDVDNLPKGPPGPTMVTQAWYVDDEGGTSEDYVKVMVTVNWVDSRSNSVSSTTLIAP